MSRVPIALVENLLFFILWRLPFVFGKEKRRITSNLQKAGGVPSESEFAQEFANQVLFHQGIVTFETMKIINDPSVANFEGIEQFADNIKRIEHQHAKHGIEGDKRSFLVVTAHLGCWEFVALNCKKLVDVDFYALAKPLSIASATTWLESLRHKMHIKVLWNNKKSLLRDMLAAIKSGHIVGFVMDQKPEGRKGPIVQFLGIDTAFVAGPASLAMKTRTPILAVFCLRVGRLKYQILSRQLYDPFAEEQMTEQELTQKCADEIARIIKLYPEQWLWNYKRWKSEDQSKENFGVNRLGAKEV